MFRNPVGESRLWCGMAMATAEECRRRLERAGWEVEESGPHTPQGHGWSVSGTRGDAAIQVWAHGRDETWRRACRRAEALGLLPQS